MIDKFLDKINKTLPEKWRWVLTHEGFRKYFKNTGWMFFGQFFSLAVSFFVGAWLARYLGPGNYGVLNYSMSFAGIFSFLASLGLDNILVRELVKNPDKRNQLLGTSFFLKLLAGIATCFLVVISAFAWEPDNLARLLIIIFSSTFILQSFGVTGLFFQATVKARKIFVSQIVAMVVSSLLKIFIILNGLNVVWVMATYVLDGVFSSFVTLIIYKKNGFKLSSWIFEWPLARALLKDSWFLMLSSVAIFIYVRIDQVIIGKLLGQIDVGYYAAAVKLSEIWNFIPAIIGTSLFPAIINSKALGREIYRRRLGLFYKLLFFISVLIAATVFLFSEPLINLLFGSGYQPSVSVLRIYVWASISMFVTVGINQQLTADNNTRALFIINLLGMAANIILNIWLIPKIGLKGAALATLISYALVPLSFLIFKGFFKKEPIPIL